MVAISVGASALELPDGWPEVATLSAVVDQRLILHSSSPYTPAELDGPSPPALVDIHLFLPDQASAPVPAVILLHGAAGVTEVRELAYARQFASMGMAALVVDSFSRREVRALGYVDRLLRVTETMMVVDAYAALGVLAAHPAVDRERIALMGFSYGAMASLFAARRTLADHFGPVGVGFAAHIAYYAPCIASFLDPTTTGAPILIAAGGRDALIDRARCAQLVDELRVGGSEVELVLHEDAYHQWDGPLSGEWNPHRGLAACRFEVAPDGTVRELTSGRVMEGYISRAVILASCSDREGYEIRGDPGVRSRQNTVLARFLTRALRLDKVEPAPPHGAPDQR